MKYNYNAKCECFVREDGLGKKLFINSHEAQRIMTMLDLGYSVPRITAKIQFKSDKVSESTVANFIKNVRDGNIVVSEDYPAPDNQVEELTIEMRLSNLEEEFKEFKDKISNPNPEKTVSDKVKSWIRL